MRTAYELVLFLSVYQYTIKSGRAHTFLSFFCCIMPVPGVMLFWLVWIVPRDLPTVNERKRAQARGFCSTAVLC